MSKPDTVLTLGDFSFSSYEIPEKMPFGGDQALAVHNLVGGRRVIDAMGKVDAPIEWSGLLFGESAEPRARYLDTLRATGNAAKLSWGAFRYQVVIKSFHGDWERWYQIPYTISCEVVSDLTKPTIILQKNGIDGWIADDMAQAGLFGDLLGDSVLSDLLGGLDTAIKGISSFANASLATINTVLAPLKAVMARVNILISSTGNFLGNSATLGGLIPGNPISTQIQGLLNKVSGAQNLPIMYELQSVLGRIGGNINSLGQ